MNQNKNKLIDLFIGNISNAIVHEILEKAIDIEEIRIKYNKEIITSFDIAKHYRNKINPAYKPFSSKDQVEIKKKVMNKVRNELQSRILRGYKNINIESTEETVDKFLRKTNIIE